jgi:cysteine synthase A
MSVNDQTINHLLETVGNTPVLPLTSFSNDNSAQIFAKLELTNPTYSVKDRIAGVMIEDLISQNKIDPQKTTIVAATGGNSGVSLSLVGVLKKIKMILFMPEDFSKERREMLRGFGASLKITPKEEGLEGAISRAQSYIKENPDCYFLDQFNHPSNVKAHYENTAEEIINDFPEGIDALVTGVGTGGTITGVGRRLKEKFPKIKIIAVEPKNSAVLSGGSRGSHQIQQLGYGFVPKNLDQELIDEVITVTDEEAYQGSKDLSSKVGVLAGISSGAHLSAAIKVAEKLEPHQKVLTFICDGGQRYFSLNQKK